MSETSVASQNIEVELKPEPWAVHLLGLITPILAISGNILGVVENQAYVAMGVVFVWGIAPILDIVMGESKVATSARIRNPFRDTSVGSWNFTASSRCHIFRLRCQRGNDLVACCRGSILWPKRLCLSHSYRSRTRPQEKRESGMETRQSTAIFLSTTLTLPTSTIMFITSG